MQEELTVTENTFQHKHGIVLIVSFGLLLCSISIAAFCLLLPLMAASLGVSWSYLCLSLVSYFIVISALLNFFRQAAARYGGIRILRLGFVLFGLGSLLSAFADGWVSLLLYSVIRAVGAACLQATVICLFVEYIPLKIYPKAVHRTSFMLFFGLLIGFILAGLISYWFTWRWVFVFLAVCSALFGFLTLKIKESSLGNKIHYDVVGVVLYLITCVSFVAGLGLASHADQYAHLSRAMFLLTIVSFLGFLFYEGRQEKPFMKLSLYRSFSFSLVMFSKFVHSFITTIFLLITVVFLFYVKKFELHQVVLLSAVVPLGITVSSVIDYFLNKKKTDNFTLFISIILFVIPVAYFVLISQLDFDWLSVVALFGFGLGSGLMQQSLMRITFEVMQEPAPVIGSVFRAMHNLGCAIAATVAIYFMSKYWLAEQSRLDAALSYILIFSLILIVVALLFGVLRGVSWLIGHSKNTED